MTNSETKLFESVLASDKVHFSTDGRSYRITGEWGRVDEITTEGYSLDYSLMQYLKTKDFG